MAVAIDAPAGSGNLQISTAKPERFLGWSAVETAGAVAEFVLRSGTGTGDPPVAHVKVVSGGSSSQWLGEQGVICPGGLFLHRVAGSTHVVVWVE